VNVVPLRVEEGYALFLPRRIDKILVPPIKCQGIKTKLVNSIAQNIRWDGRGRWVEPFLGSGVVLFNVAPEGALAADSNEHIIRFYRGLQTGHISPGRVYEHLKHEGERLSRFGARYYYEVRDRFNRRGDPIDFLFLIRSCFNGVMRFNSEGRFNVPFCRKPDRFRPAYITKIVHQVERIAKVIRAHANWEIRHAHWRDVLAECKQEDFVYFDPPYVGRHTDYYNSWDDSDALELAREARNLACGFALSMWLRNRYRTNKHLLEEWNFATIRSFNHFYHVGSTEDLRGPMEEALVIKPGYETSDPANVELTGAAQGALGFH